MHRWKDTAESARFTSYGHSSGQGRDTLDRWVERTRCYLRSRTVDHWLMFAGGLLIGALLG